MDNLYTWGWIVWLLYLAILEGIALFNSKPGDTFSEHMWIWFGTKRNETGQPEAKRTGWMQFRRFILVAGMAWLSFHFISGGWV